MYDIYREHLLEVNSYTNLTTITDPSEIKVKHFDDSLSIIDYISEDSKVLDVGSGAGFPGIPLRIEKNFDLTLIDSVNKKVRFMNEVIEKLELKNTRAIHTRAEDFAKEKRGKYDVVISIDTSQPEVIRAAVKAGAHIWNDVRALTRPQALETAAELNIPVILMHMRGEPTNMNQLDQYTNVTEDVMYELEQRLDQALEMGIKKYNIILDPGFGFAKNAQQNFQLLNEFWKLNQMGYPILSGLSRKRFIGEALNGIPAQERAVGSVAGHLMSIQQGASIVRAHDVKATSDAINVWKMMFNQ